MPRSPENRAAVFAQQSPEVEVHSDGAWWPGAILGWRHDRGGVCEVWVRAVVRGESRTTWTQLSALRLPEASPGDGAEPVGAQPSAGGTGRAPGTTAGPSVRPGHMVAPGRGPRRHGGEVTAEFSVVRAGMAGRHRAPSGAGRHRAADQEAVRSPSPGVATGSSEGGAPAAAATAATAATTGTATATTAAGQRDVPVRAESDCLTRPLRLGERVGRPGLPRLG